jgi:hypothetical protein
LSGRKLTRSLIFDGGALSLPHSIVVTVTIEPAISALVEPPDDTVTPVHAAVQDTVLPPEPTAALEPAAPPESAATPVDAPPAKAVMPAETHAPIEAVGGEPGGVAPPPSSPLAAPVAEPVEAPSVPTSKLVASSSPLGFVSDLCAVVGTLIGSVFGTGSLSRPTVAPQRAPAAGASAKTQAGGPTAKSQPGRTVRSARTAAPEVRRPAARRSDGRSR